MKFAALGDNCIDVYERLGKKYPTGNVVDTAVNMQMLGIPASIISTTGNDANGEWMVKTLKEEGIDISHLKVGNGPTAITYMDMDGLERIHGHYEEGVLEQMTFDEDDICFAAQHDLVHTALWGKAENVLPMLKEKGAVISFDYADRLNHPLIDQTIPFVDYGFFSYKNGRDEVIEQYLKDKIERGMVMAVATFGEKGSLVFDGQDFYEGKTFPAKVVNTVGAGDSFIAGFLYELLMGSSIPKAQNQGAKVAAEVVSVFEPWVKRK
jgi:fructoselysine 6-kinase